MIICLYMDGCFLGVNYFLFFILLNFLYMYSLFGTNVLTDPMNAWQSLFQIQTHHIIHPFHVICPGDLLPQPSVLLLK